MPNLMNCLLYHRQFSNTYNHSIRVQVNVFQFKSVLNKLDMPHRLLNIQMFEHESFK